MCDVITTCEREIKATKTQFRSAWKSFSNFDLAGYETRAKNSHVTQYFNIAVNFLKCVSKVRSYYLKKRHFVIKYKIGANVKEEWFKRGMILLISQTCGIYQQEAGVYFINIIFKYVFLLWYVQGLKKRGNAFQSRAYRDPQRN